MVYINNKTLTKNLVLLIVNQSSLELLPNETFKTTIKISVREKDCVWGIFLIRQNLT